MPNVTPEQLYQLQSILPQDVTNEDLVIIIAAIFRSYGANDEADAVKMCAMAFSLKDELFETASYS